jgi:hypothetical protein
MLKNDSQWRTGRWRTRSGSHVHAAHGVAQIRHIGLISSWGSRRRRSTEATASRGWWLHHARRPSKAAPSRWRRRTTTRRWRRRTKAAPSWWRWELLLLPRISSVSAHLVLLFSFCCERRHHNVLDQCTIFPQPSAVLEEKTPCGANKYDMVLLVTGRARTSESYLLVHLLRPYLVYHRR